MTMQSLEFHQTFSSKSVIEKVIDKIMILPVVEFDIGAVPTIVGDQISILVGHDD